LAAASLGDLYAEGRGVTQDYSEAARWYRRAAERGHPGGQNRLAHAYLNSKGVSGDPVQGYAWLELAASADPAKYGAERDRVASQLNPNQLAEVQKLVLEFQPKRGQ
jgi:TPR repeat protein